MKTSLNKYLIILLAIVVTLSCSKNEADPVVVPEPTAQEMILGTWNIDRATTDINAWNFEQGEVTVTFRQDSVMIFTNNGSQTILPSGDFQLTYYIEKLCWFTLDMSCTVEERIDVLITNDIFDVYNSVRFSESNNELIFGEGHQDGTQYYCTKINVNL